MKQISLLEYAELTKADKAFQAFHEDNPRVYESLVQMAHQLKRAGHQKVGIAMLFEVLRWRSMIQTHGDPFKLNNNYKSRYARKIMDENRDLNEIFETRELKT